MYRIFMLVILTLCCNGALAQSSLRIDKLERKSLKEASREVGFSTLIEGTVDDPNKEVFVFVYQPHLGGWLPFHANVDTNPEMKGQYRWRAICQFGELGGKGKGSSYKVRAMVFDKKTVMEGLPERALSQAEKTEVVLLKRVR
jgi:hypothetical protein